MKRVSLWVLLGLSVVGILILGINLEFEPARESPGGMSGREGVTTDKIGAEELTTAKVDREVSQGDQAELDAVRKGLQGLREGRVGRAVDEIHGAFAKYERLREMIHGLDPGIAAKGLIEFLRSGEDGSTGLPFLVGEEGVLDGAPTLRTAALDLLGQTEPGMALRYSWEVIGSTRSADEYALALRNVAWAVGGEGWDEQMVSAFLRMLGNEEWVKAPSDGFLEAFDFGPAIGGRAYGPIANVLERAVREGNSVVAHAAFVALDRMMLREPGEVARRILGEWNLFSGMPDYRASLLSRLDVRDGVQRQALEEYLERVEPGSREAEYFFRVFPNGNGFDSPRLVTTSRGEWEGRAMGLIDEATLRWMDEWAREKPGFAGHWQRFEELAARIRKYYSAGP